MTPSQRIRPTNAIEVLWFVPAQFKILEEQREKLACPRCPEQGVTTADSEKVMD